MAQAELIRLADKNDLPALANIERAAAALFATVGMHAIAASKPLPVDVLERQREAALLWVYDRPPCAFALAMALPRSLHLHEVSVHPARSRQGIGAALIRAVTVAANVAGFSSVTLSTFREVPWNAPYYAKLGFVEVPADALEPALIEIRQREQEHGLDISQRVIMRLACEAYATSVLTLPKPRGAT